MATGDFWNTDNPSKPWGLFDPDAEIVFPVGIADWLSELSTTYADHQVIADAPLNCISSSQSGGVISVRIKLADDATYKPGTKYPFTIRLIGTDAQQDDRTLWLKVGDR